MKRKSLLFLLLMALGLPWAAQAQEELTVNDGTATNNCIPIYGLYVDTQGQNSEFIIPAETEGMSDMEGGTISKLAFYISTVPETWGSPTVQVYMGEVEGTTLSSLNGPTNFTTVWTGTLSNQSATMEITLSTPYTYNGGNLLIGMYVQTASSTYKGTSFSGITAPSGSSRYNSGNSGSGSGSAVSFLPKTTFTYTPGAAPSCPKPTNLTVSNVTSSNASFSWTKGGDETEWVLEYSTDANFTNAVSVPRSGIPAIAIDDFAPATTYYARVKAICGGGDESSWSNKVSFTTPCDAYNIPYTYGFEEAASFNCWTVISGNITRISGTPNTGNYRLDFRGTTSNMIALPQFNEGTNNLRVEFYTRPESTSSSCGKFAIGYMTDINDASTFVAVETYPVSDWTTASYVKKAVDFVNAPAGANIAMRQFDCSTYYYWYVDDVTVKEIPSCLAPTGLEATNITTNSATINWTPGGNETKWRVEYNLASVADPFSGTTGHFISTVEGEPTYTITNLPSAATSYVVRVIAICGDEDESEGSEVLTFTTACEAITAFPWTEDFESYSTGDFIVPCWVNEHISGNGTKIFGVSTSNAHGTSTKQLNLPDQSSGTMTKLVLPEMTLTTGDSYLFSIDVYRVSASSYTGEGIRVYASTNGEIEGATELAFISRNYSTGDGNLIPAETASGWYTYELPIPFTGTCYIILRGESKYGSATYMDNFVVKEAPACPKPTGLAVVANSVTAHTAQLSWTSEASAWEICLNGDEEHPIPADANPFELTGLTENTAYTAKVRAVCDGTPGEEWTSTVSFTTPIACPAPTGLAVSGITGYQTTLNWTGTSESYDVLYRTAAYAEGVYEEFGTSIPSGWEMYTGQLTDGTATMTAATYGWSFGTNNGVFDNHARVNIYSNYQRWLVTKAFTVLQDASTLSFDLALTAFSGPEVPAPQTTGTDDKFIVLISNDNMATWITLREWNNAGSQYVYNNIANTATGEPVSIDLREYVGQSVRIAFYGESTESNADNNLHIDNVYCGIPHEAGEWQTAAEGVTETTYTLTGLDPETDYDAKVLSHCEGETGHEIMVSFTTEAACMVPTGLEAVPTTTTAVLTWTSSSTAWQIQVDEEDPIDVTENPYTLEGLNPATTYTFKVRANCDGTYTEWSESMSFTTECDVITVDADHPFTEGFEGTTFAPLCWESIASGSHAWSRNTGYKHTGSASAYSGYYGDIYLVMPELQISNEAVAAQLTFWSYNSYTSDYDKNSVVLLDGENEIELWSPESVSQSWEETTIELNDYIGQTISIAFKYEGSNAHGWYIDDVTVEIVPVFPLPITGYTGTKDHYYLIASPVGQVNPEAVGQMTDNSFDLYRYNPVPELIENIGYEWENWKFEDNYHFDLEPGRGYLYANSEDVTLTFMGTPISDNEYEVDLAFDEHSNLGGWNLLGNPFATTATITATDNENNNLTLEFYVMNEDGDDYEASVGDEIEAMQGIFVVATAEGQKVTFSPANSGKTRESIVLNLSRNRGNVIDRAIVRVGNGGTLPKFMLNSDHTKLYIPQDNEDFAVVTSAAQGETPVSFKAAENGIYTLNVNTENLDVNYLHLIDNMTGADVNLLETPAYTFNAQTTDYANRFKLVYATGNAVEDDFAFFSNGNLIINNEGNATLQVVDITGRILSSESISGSCSKSLNVSAGVYMLRLVNGDNVKVQKVVVK